MHEDILRFGMDGKLDDDSSITRLREQFISMVISDMREQGVVPVLDWGPHWTLEYDALNDNFKFELSVYGIRVGRRLALQIEGINLEGRRLLRTQPHKLSQS